MSVSRHRVLARRSERRGIGDDPAQEEMKVVVECHADATVHLHAVLDQLRPVAADIELPGADELCTVGRRRGRRRPPLGP